MKLPAIVAAMLFAAVAGLSAGGVYAEDAAADKAPAKGTTHDDTMQKHSHVQEKTGAAPKAKAPAADDKTNAAKDAHKHFHPRDAK